jgi:hypothetical protein
MPYTKPARQSNVVAAVATLALLVAACSFAPGQQSQYAASVATGLQPRLSPADAVAITIAYLNDQHPDPPPIRPHVSVVWAVRAADARSHDGCIPAQDGDAIVWITKGVGDYLNVSDRPWSHRTGATNDVCQLPGPEGTLVIDDGSGEIIGVYPESPGYPHPSP